MSCMFIFLITTNTEACIAPTAEEEYLFLRYFYSVAIPGLIMFMCYEKGAGKHLFISFCSRNSSIQEHRLNC